MIIWLSGYLIKLLDSFTEIALAYICMDYTPISELYFEDTFYKLTSLSMHLNGK